MRLALALLCTAGCSRATIPVYPGVATCTTSRTPMIVDFALAAVTQAAVIYADHAYYEHEQPKPQPVPDGNVADGLGPVLGVAIVAPILEIIPIAFVGSGIYGATHICKR